MRIIKSLKSINYRMFVALFFLGLIPTLYTTLRIFLIGKLPGDWGFNIASQLQWVSLIYEVLQEALILPLFFFIGAVVLDKKELVNRIKTGLFFTFIIYTVLSTILFVFAKPIVIFMAQDKSVINQTVTYIRLETIAMIFGTLFKYVMVTLVTIKKDHNLYIVLILQLILTVIADIFLVSNLNISFKLGINGIAISNIIVNLITFIITIFLLNLNGIKLLLNEKLDFGWLRDLVKKGGVSGLESFVRNLAFILMISRMVNVVGESGTFWIANNFIWGWLLLPVIQLGELVKADVGEDGFLSVKNKSLGYFTLTTVFIIFWLVTFPFWKPFMKNVLQIGNYLDVFNIVVISVFFYVLFAYNNVIDSIFYGLGKTNYMLFQSLIINTIFYGTAFVLYQVNVFEPNLRLIALMFAGGTALDSILTIIMYKWMLKRNNIKLDFE